MAGRFSIEAVFKAVDRITAPVSRMQNRVGKFTRSMSRGLRRVNRGLGVMLNGLRRGATAALRFGGVAVIGGVTATALALNKSADAADKLAKRARRLQFPIEELQEWQFVAEQSGLSTDQFDSAVEAFTKRMGEARSGIGMLRSMLSKTNPELLAQLEATTSVSEALDIYLEAIRQTPDAANRAAMAAAAFSRSGLAMGNIADNTAAQVAAMRGEMRENGVITMQQAEAAEAYNDAVNSLKRTLTALMHDVLLPMTPELTKNVRAFREWAIANKELIKVRITEFFNRARNAAVQLWERIKNFNEAENIMSRLGRVVEMTAEFFGFLADHGKTIAKVLGTVIALSLALRVFAGVMAVVNIVLAANPIGLVVLAIAAMIAIVASAIIWWDELKAAFFNMGPAFDVFLAGVGLLFGPIGALVAMAAIITRNWEPLSAFFSDLWGGIKDTFANTMKWIEEKLAIFMGFVERIKAAGASVGDFFGGGDDGAEVNRAAFGPGPQVVSPQERIAREISETATSNTSEVTIRDETGRAEQTGGTMGPGVTLQPSGAF